MKLVQSGGWFDIGVDPLTKEKYFDSGNDVGEAEISIVRNLFYNWSDHNIIEYILTDDISTGNGLYNMSNKPAIAVHNYQNMNIQLGKTYNDGSKSDFFKIFSKLPSQGHRDAVLSSVRRKRDVRERDISKFKKKHTQFQRSKSKIDHITELRKADQQHHILYKYNKKLIRMGGDEYDIGSRLEFPELGSKGGKLNRKKSKRKLKKHKSKKRRKSKSRRKTRKNRK